MAKEIERKFLVFNDKLPKLRGGVLCVQGYLCVNPLIRFRTIKNNVCINIKKLHGDSSIRDEWEFNNKLKDEEIEELIKLSINPPIKKIRYNIKYKGLLWELDVYQGENSGLITADIEIPDSNYKIIFPDWIDKNKEITNNKRYFNRNLGGHPFRGF